uniref:V-type proton ATPase subunit G n=1 Tax=Schistocephalus solidus TaxID=70667 RepID=A0A0X3PGK7_SCHSO
MSSAHQLDGVSQLQQAKAAATAKIEAARARRIIRLKQAKDEAKLDIDAYKQEREAGLKELELTLGQSNTDSDHKIGAFTRYEMSNMQLLYTQNKEAALATLLREVLTVTPSVHRNMSCPANG